MWEAIKFFLKRKKKKEIRKMLGGYFISLSRYLFCVSTQCTWVVCEDKKGRREREREGLVLFAFKLN